MFYGMQQFSGVRENAANIVQGKGGYTVDMFLADFPQFYCEDGSPPDHILEMFAGNASAAIQPGRWFEKWRYACGLYTAHYLTLYLRTYADGSATSRQAAASGATVGVVKSATLGDSSITYDTDALTRGTEKWGGLNATQYGQLLATEARLVGMGGTYAMGGCL